MTPKEATEILHSLTPGKQQEAAKILQFLVKNMKGKTPQGGNWNDLNQTQKMVIITAFCIEYGRRTAEHEPAANTSGTGTTGTAAETN